MGTICIYAIKSAISLAIMYIPYMLLLRNETFYRFNRIVLVGILLLSLALPMFNISPLAFLDHTEMGEANRAITGVGIPMIEIGNLSAELDYDAQQTLTNASAQDKSMGWAEVVVALYITGLCVTLIIKLVQLLRMLSFMRKGCLWTSEEDGVKTYCHIRNVAPFSWMNNIVISESDYNEGGREILMHEQAHIRCGHSYDVCLVAICEVLQWFNPFIWLVSSSLADVHEYEADAEVLSKGVDARSYQMLLIKKAVGTSSYAFANSFNHSLLKKRITMMLKKKSSPWMRTKALYVIPMAGIALSAFATSEFTNSAELISESKVSNLPTKVQETAPESAIMTEQTNVTAPQTEVPQPQTEVKEDPKKKKPLVVVDGKIVENVISASRSKALTDVYLAKLARIKAEDIHSISVLKSEKAVALYGEKGADGAIEITTKAQADKAKETADATIALEDTSDVLMVCEQMPQFPGGQQEMMKFIATNIRYPAVAQENGAQGRVLVQFVIEKDGTACEHKILNSKINRIMQSPKPTEDSIKSEDKLVVQAYSTTATNDSVEFKNARIALEKEAIRVLQLMPKWEPGMQKGEAVRVRYTIPITYRLR
jgi:TonB-dependent SusC/RagA subfamily outer membrane receptor